MKKILFVLFLSAGFSFLITTTASAFFVSALSKIPGKRIAVDYGINISTLPARVEGSASNNEYVIHTGYPRPNKIIYWIKTGSPSPVANACIDFRISYDSYTCEYVKLVPKK